MPDWARLLRLRQNRRSEPTPTPADPAARVVILVRDGCHLCQEALAVAQAECEPHGVVWESLDVDAEPSLRDAYTDHVPVTFVDGQRLSYWALAPERLRSALTGR